jgi:hypothetical protein
LTITAQPVAKWKMMLISSSTASFYGLSGSHSTLLSELITSTWTRWSPVHSSEYYFI